MRFIQNFAGIVTMKTTNNAFNKQTKYNRFIVNALCKNQMLCTRLVSVPMIRQSEKQRKTELFRIF